MGSRPAIRLAATLMLLALVWPAHARAEDTHAVLDSLMDTAEIPKPLLDVFAKAYDEDWVYFGGGFHQNYYFIPGTVRTTPSGTKTVWGVNVQGSDGNDWLSSRAAIIEQRSRVHHDPALYRKYLFTRIQWELDCEGHRDRILQIVDYDEAGAVIWSGHLKGGFHEPEPDSNGDGILQAFCNRRSRTTFRDIVNTPMGVQLPDKP